MKKFSKLFACLTRLKIHAGTISVRNKPIRIGELASVVQVVVFTVSSLRVNIFYLLFQIVAVICVENEHCFHELDLFHLLVTLSFKVQ